MTLEYRLVCFDVDSTLVTIEGIDVLSGDDPRITRLTEAAMNGEIPLDEVYGRRLDAIRPRRESVEKLAARYLASLVPGARETVTALREAGANVHLVTAGIEMAVLPLADHLGIPRNAVHAVALHFTAEGEYAGFDGRSFLTRPGGKEVVVRDLRSRMHGKAAFIGDGISDLETKHAVDLFIGFGGVLSRARVKENSEVFVEGPRLTAVLPYLISGTRSEA